MAITVDVLYADLTRQTVTLGNVANLLKAGVLGIVVSTNQETGALRNIMDVHGNDHYSLGYRVFNGQTNIMLFGWDDDQFVWRRTTNVHDIDARTVVNAPVGHLSVTFDGQGVDNTTWDAAILIYQNDMLFGD